MHIIKNIGCIKSANLFGLGNLFIYSNLLMYQYKIDIYNCCSLCDFLNFHIEVHLLRQIYFTIIRYKIISNNNIKKLLAILKKVFDINFFQESQKQLRKCLKKSSKFVKIEKVKFKASFVDRNGRTELSI